MFITLRSVSNLASRKIAAKGCNFFSTGQTLANESIVLSHLRISPPGSESSPPLLITHGLLGSKTNWNSIAKALAKSTQRTIITFDARNHGDSPHTNEMNYDVMAEDILTLGSHLGIPKFSLMGHSMGGRAVMTFGLRNPEKLDKLIVVDVSPTVISADFSEMESYIRALLGQKFEDEKVTLSNARKHVDKALATVAQNPSIRAFLLTNLASTKDGKVYWKPNLQALLNNLNKIAEFPRDLLPETIKYTGSSLFIRGGKSLYIPDSDVPNIKAKFTRAHIATIQEAGHWPHADKPADFIKIATDYLNL